MTRLAGGVPQPLPDSQVWCTDVLTYQLECVSRVRCPAGGGYFDGSAAMQGTSMTGSYDEDAYYRPYTSVSCPLTNQ